MKKKMFTIISLILDIVVVAGLFLPYMAGNKATLSIWQLFGNAFAIAGVSFSVIGILGTIFNKNELNYLICGYYIGIHIYLFSVLHNDANFLLQFSNLGIGFYVQAGGVFLLLLATFISGFFNKKENVVQEKRNNTEVKTTVNNGQMNMPVNSFKSLPVENKEEEKTMPKPDLLSGVKQNNDSLFVNSNLFVNTSDTNNSLSSGPSLLDPVHIPDSAPSMASMPSPSVQNSMPAGMMAPPVQNSMPTEMMAPPAQNSMPADIMAPPVQNSMPADIMAPPAQNSMPAEMMAPPVQNSMPAEMMAPPAQNSMPADIMAPPAQNSMPTEMMAPPVQNSMPADIMAPPAQNSMPTEMMPSTPQIGGVLGGLPQPSQEGGADVVSLMNEGPSVEDQLKMFNASHQAQDPGLPKPDLLAGSNLSGVLGNDSNGN